MEAAVAPVEVEVAVEVAVEGQGEGERGQEGCAQSLAACATSPGDPPAAMCCNSLCFNESRVLLASRLTLRDSTGRGQTLAVKLEACLLRMGTGMTGVRMVIVTEGKPCSVSPL